jgi:phage terminase small subunit
MGKYNINTGTTNGGRSTEILPDDRMSGKMVMFCREWVRNGHNGEQAALFAKYSPKTARHIASENLTKPNIKAFIDKLEQPVLAKLGLDENWVLTKLKNFSEALITDYFELDEHKNIVLKDLSTIPKSKIEAIESIEQDKEGKIKIKLVGKRASVVDIGKNYGMFKELIEGNINHQHTHKVYVVPAFSDDNVDSKDYLLK